MTALRWLQARIAAYRAWLAEDDDAETQSRWAW